VTSAGIDEVLGAEAAQEDPFGSGSLAAAQYEPFSFTVKRLVLASLADKAISVIPTGNTMPVLKHFLVQVAPGLLRMAASDLELSVLASTPAVTADAVQTLVLPARRLLQIVREAPGDDIIVDVAGEFAAVRSGTAKWDLFLADCSEYPPLPDPAEVTMHPVGREEFLGALKTVRHAVGRDSGRPALMQVDISAPAAGQPGTTQVTACDSVRFARTALAGFGLSMQIPSGALDSLVKTLESSEQDEVHTGETEAGSRGFLVFRIGGTVFLAAKTMAKFPDVEKLLLRPALENRLVLTADKAELAAAVRRVRINADPETSAVGLKLSAGSLAVIARDKYGNRAEETVSAGWEHGERLVVVNHQFLTELLAAHPSPACRFFLGPEAGKKRSVLMLRDEESGTTGIVYQMLASLVGYGEQ
jgi:DNA polymerase-3 subunit beta